MIRRPPRSTPFPTRRSSDLPDQDLGGEALPELRQHERAQRERAHHADDAGPVGGARPLAPRAGRARSEEHTSELQSRLHLVCRLLLEKKKKTHMILKPLIHM